MLTHCPLYNTIVNSQALWIVKISTRCDDVTWILWINGVLEQHQWMGNCSDPELYEQVCNNVLFFVLYILGPNLRIYVALVQKYVDIIVNNVILFLRSIHFCLSGITHAAHNCCPIAVYLQISITKLVVACLRIPIVPYLLLEDYDCKYYSVLYTFW